MDTILTLSSLNNHKAKQYDVKIYRIVLIERLHSCNSGISGFTTWKVFWIKDSSIIKRTIFNWIFVKFCAGDNCSYFGEGCL